MVHQAGDKLEAAAASLPLFHKQHRAVRLVARPGSYGSSIGASGAQLDFR